MTRLLQSIPHHYRGEPVNILGLAYDSRRVKSGDLFFAVPGLKVDGHDFVKEAQENGAIAAVVSRDVPVTIPQIVVPDSREAMGRIAAAYYDHPSRSMRMIGVTGTNGKTTTTYLVKAILEHAGAKVGLIGTIHNMIGSRVIPAVRTTPESLDLQQLLASMQAADVQYVVMEVSSHALALQRTAGAEYDVGIFTNLTQDHLDFHPSFAEYLEAKSRLFSGLSLEGTKQPKAAIINFDDSHYLTIMAKSSAPVISYGVNREAQVTAHDVEVASDGVSFRVVTWQGEAQLSLRITGRFNVYNALAAIASCLIEGVPLGTIKEALESISGVSGRFELVNAGQDFAVVVDYAHTPDSLENVLRTARNVAQCRVIVVFGAGGDRDKGKRPVMGRVAAELSDYVIITSDNPRGEEPAAICEQVEVGIRDSLDPPPYELIVSRRDAIRRAIEIAQSGDLVLIAGKGHETYQEFSGTTVHFDDREEAYQAAKERSL